MPNELLDAMLSLGRPTPQSGVTRGLNTLGDALEGVAQRRQQRALERARLQQQAEEAAYANQRARDIAEANEQNEMARHRENIAIQRQTQQRQDRKDAAGHLEKTLPLLQGTAPQVSRFNALSGPYGLQARQREAPPMPERPQGPAPIDLMDMLMMRPTQQGIQNINQAEKAAGAYQQEAAKVEETKRNPIVDIDMAGELYASVHGNELQEARRAQAAQAVEPFTELSASDIERKADAATKAALDGGTLKLEGAAQFRQGIIEAEKNRLARARRGGGRGDKPMTPGEKVDNERAAVTGFSGEYDKWEKHTNVDKLTDQYDLFGGMSASAKAYRDKGDIINQRKALYEAARFITGPGILRQEEYDNTVRKTAGWSETLATKIQQNLQGDISEAEWAAMEKFVASAEGTIKQKAIRAVKNFDKKFNDKNFYRRNVPDDVAGSRAALMERFGLTDEDVAGGDAKKAGTPEDDAKLRELGF